jgi:hypothetical protein
MHQMQKVFLLESSSPRGLRTKVCFPYWFWCSFLVSQILMLFRSSYVYLTFNDSSQLGFVAISIPTMVITTINRLSEVL